KILDPACGSGSFLLGAYQYLLDWHRDQYVNDEPEKWAKGRTPRLYQTDRGEWRLTTDERKRILLNNIYGVDIDHQAVEVTKLSLLLKVLEGEDEQSIGKQIALFQERVLPDLANNIKCGNSLIGSDFHENQQMSLLDEEEMYRVNAFDWETEFADIMKNGGFDAVIGNPPYFNISTLDKKILNYLRTNYSEIHTGYNDIMYYFVYKGVVLLNKYGYFGFITSNYYLGNNYAKLLRNYLKNYVEQIINFKNYLVFKDANVHTNIICACKTQKEKEIFYFEKKDGNEINTIDLNCNFSLFKLERGKLQNEWVLANEENLHLFEKVSYNCYPLGDISEIEKGSTSGKNKIFTVSYEVAKINNFEKEILRKNVKNGDIRRYRHIERGNYLIYTDNNTNITEYQNIYKYLQFHKKTLMSRNEIKRGLYEWYRLERPRKKYIFDAPEKLIVPYRASKNRFSYDNEQYFNNGGDIRVIVLKPNINISIKYILGIVNSKLLNWYYQFIGKPKGNSREYFNKPLSLIPIRTIDFSNPTEKADHDLMVNLVNQMLDVNKKLADAGNPQAKDMLQRQIEATDKQIDQLVYKLYDLTNEEIKIVESET
ncbi:MAG: DNA methyltransferase, partial [Thermodesulfobacteriota bacterium]|nr:DNA methyltransferase [Thermodesulfobacteriota bacterium]